MRINVKHLVLYETPTPDNARLDIGEAFAAADPSDALATFMSYIGVTDDELETLKATPFWPYSLSFAPSMPV
jgi:hypothetical protein